MSAEKIESTGVDIIKVYIWGMASLSLITFVWLIINYILLQKYKTAWDIGEENLREILEKEKEMPEKTEKDVEDIKDPFFFFTRIVRGLPETPQVDTGEWSRESIDGQEFEEKKYIIHFKKGAMDRQNLARYIYIIQREKNVLKLKDLRMSRAENSKSSDDRWEAELVFAQRRPVK